MERQVFGFKYQSDFCKKLSLKEDNEYTSKFDAYTKKLPIQIKTYKNNGELMMADPFRYINNNSDFILVVTNRNEKGEIISERILLIENEKFKIFLNENKFSVRAEYCKFCLDVVTNKKEDDELFHQLMEIEKVKRKNSILNMQAKRDHKKQKRVQWSIPNRHINTFLSMFKELDKKDLETYN